MLESVGVLVSDDLCTSSRCDPCPVHRIGVVRRQPAAMGVFRHPDGSGVVPTRETRRSTNIFLIAGSLLLLVEFGRILLPVSSADTVEIDPPFKGEWYVFHGGASALINHHYRVTSQSHALDILIPAEGGIAGRATLTLDTHPSFGQTLYAPADGRVVKVVNDRPDMKIGERDTEQIVGNQVVIEIGEGRYFLMAHLMEGSVAVSVGDSVKSGQAVARCGNSGNTTEPHLHTQVQSHADFSVEGLRTYPIRWRGITRQRGGRKERHVEAVDLRRNDVVIVEAN